MNADPRTRRFVILDRDGTINVDRDHLSDPADLELIPRAASGLRKLRDAGFGLVVVTNQSVVGRGTVDGAGLEAIHAKLAEILAEENTKVDALYHCPHVPEDGCSCRKPQADLVWQAARDLGFDPGRSFLVGDHLTDIEMGRAVGATTILVRTGHGNEIDAFRGEPPDHVAADLDEAADIILSLVEQEEERERADGA